MSSALTAAAIEFGGQILERGDRTAVFLRIDRTVSPALPSA
jgi:hypothetical protein